VLASIDLAFVIERPDQLRDLVTALAGRLATSARGTARPVAASSLSRRPGLPNREGARLQAKPLRGSEPLQALGPGRL
jgi:hypothetical protein